MREPSFGQPLTRNISRSLAYSLLTIQAIFIILWLIVKASRRCQTKHNPLQQLKEIWDELYTALKPPDIQRKYQIDQYL